MIPSSSSSHVVFGAGPVARSVVASLTARGVRPVVVTRSGVKIPDSVSVRADISDVSAATVVLAGAEVVYQCAQPAYQCWPQEFPALQASVLHAARSSGALLVAAENLYGYAPPTTPLTEDLPLTAKTRKGAIRAAMWQQLEAAHRSGDVRVVAARASDFFGPGVAVSTVGDRFFGPLLADKTVRVLGDPDFLHTYTYVGDFGEALVRLSESPVTWGSAWHVPNSPTITTRQFAERAAAIAGTTATLRPVADWQLRLIGAFVPAVREMREMRYEFDRDWVVSHDRYVSVLGDHATPLDEALRATVASRSPERR